MKERPLPAVAPIQGDGTKGAFLFIPAKEPKSDKGRRRSGRHACGSCPRRARRSQADEQIGGPRIGSR